MESAQVIRKSSEEIKLQLTKYGLLVRAFIALIESMKAHVVCPICHVIFIGSSILSCGHCFCTHCIKWYLTHKEYCPICDKYIQIGAICSRTYPVDCLIEDFYRSLGNMEELNTWVNPNPLYLYLSNMDSWTLEFMENQVQTFKVNPVPVIITPHARAQLLEARQRIWQINEPNRYHHVQEYIDKLAQFIKLFWFYIIGLIVYLLIEFYGNQFMDPYSVKILQMNIGVILFTGLGRYYSAFFYSAPTRANPLGWFFEQAIPVEEQMMDPQEEENNGNDQDQQLPTWTEIRAIIYAEAED